ncbi:hypothetical protein EON66_05550 [archaeon]|nr:MAG: hypothetical protein EON66_05550 [archaeon]
MTAAAAGCRDVVRPRQLVPLAQALGVSADELARVHARAQDESHAAPLKPKERRILQEEEVMEQHASSFRRSLVHERQHRARSREGTHPAGILGVDDIYNADTSSSRYSAAMNIRKEAAARASSCAARRMERMLPHVSGSSSGETHTARIAAGCNSAAVRTACTLLACRRASPWV